MVYRSNCYTKRFNQRVKQCLNCFKLLESYFFEAVGGKPFETDLSFFINGVFHGDRRALAVYFQVPLALVALQFQK